MSDPWDGSKPIANRSAAQREKQYSCRSEFAAYDACIQLGLSSQVTSLPDSREAPVPPVPMAPHPSVLGCSKAQLVGAHSPHKADHVPGVLWNKRHPFASCCSWVSNRRVHSVCSATLIDRFIFQSIYLLNYPTVSKKSFLINMVISQSGWQQKHILVQLVDKADFPLFQASPISSQYIKKQYLVTLKHHHTPPRCLTSIRACLEISSSQVLSLSHIFTFYCTLGKDEAHVSFNLS